MSWVGWRKFYYYYYCRNIMKYLVELLNFSVLTAMCLYGYIVLIAVV